MNSLDEFELESARLLMGATKSLQEVFDHLQLDARERDLLYRAALNYGEAMSSVRHADWMRAITSAAAAQEPSAAAQVTGL